MTWFVWRQHRIQFLAGAALLAALAVLLVITGLQMASQYHSALVACAANHNCANLSSSLFLGSHAVGFLVIMTLGAARRPWLTSAGSSPTSPPTATGRSRASRPASSSSWPPPSSRSPR